MKGDPTSTLPELTTMAHQIDGTASLEQLATTIGSTVSVLTKYLQEKNLPQPSFLPDGPTDFPSEAPLKVASARVDLVTAARQLYFLALWPRESVQWNLAHHHHDSSSTRWLYHFNIFRAVPLEGTIAISTLAAQTRLDEDRLTRILRHAMTNHLFTEPEEGQVAHTAQSALLAKDVALSSLVGHCTEELFPASAKLVEATSRVDEPKTRPAFNIAFDTDLDAMAFIGKDPFRSERFAESMKGMIHSEPWNISHVVTGYDWEALGEAVVVDVSANS